MDYITDLHIHSRYAAACSDKLTIENIERAAEEKGINIIGTGDFTHPKWMEELKSSLKEGSEGMYHANNERINFVLSSEVCTISNPEGKGAKKVHTCIIAPSITDAESINSSLSKHGNLGIDGRPVLMISAEELANEIKEACPEAILFPAHIWTPWFGALGAMSGFNSMEDAYGSAAKHISGYETGLSSDPPMNWRVSKLDRYAMLSNSDAHSLPKLAREATVFDLKEPSYKELANAITSNKNIRMTVEFYPEEGKYHFDGHRNCKVSLSPEQSKRYNGICPVCRRKLTIGVMHRVDELADREEGYVPKNAPSYVHAVPLIEIISQVTGKGQGTAQVTGAYSKMITKFGNEMNALINAKPEDLEAADREVGKAIERVREERIKVTPGYDGVFGIVELFKDAVQQKANGQRTINEF
ncbi:MAG: endonuclease Q family protein [Candidatus Marsarchaeota archaeon]|jgi:uncharacterized protein (TIGR00375 family)|nr:endonuclease Q family protein [Candidatus Marsarchaeota archaeon]